MQNVSYIAISTNLHILERTLKSTITASTNCDLWAKRRKTPSDEDDKWMTDLSNPALYSLESQAGLVAINFYSIWGQTLLDWKVISGYPGFLSYQNRLMQLAPYNAPINGSFCN